MNNQLLVEDQITEVYSQQISLRRNGQGINYEKQVTKVYESVLEDGHISIDVGGNKGIHTIPMSRKVAPSGKVIVFEGNPEMAMRLKNNIEQKNLAQYCEIHSMAVSSYDGETEFVVALDYPGYSGIKERVYDKPNMRLQKIRVTCHQLDTVLSHLNRCDFIKIDVEGGEYDVLQGGRNLIDKFKPVITFECGVKSYGNYGVKPENIADFFLSRNYVIYDVLGNELNSKEVFIHSDSTPGLWDYVAIPQEHQSRAKIINSLKI